MKNETFSVRVCVGGSIFSAFAISVFQFAQVAPQFLVMKVPRNLSKFSKSVKLRNTIAFD